jgi:tetratricopeptide (TPR) repeat protein
MHFNRTFIAASCSTFLLATLGVAPKLAAQDALQSVRELYASAAYEDALTAVGKIDSPAEPNIEAEQYRVFCLVALNRMDEAAQAVESVLTLRPEYRPNAADASPRIMAMFSQVRRRMGPVLVKRLYQQGRAAMDRRDRDDAVAQFEAMLRMANDEDVRNEASVSELRELGSGFLELSKALPAKPKPADPAPAASAPASVIPPTVIRSSGCPPFLTRSAERRNSAGGRVQIG